MGGLRDAENTKEIEELMKVFLLLRLNSRLELKKKKKTLVEGHGNRTLCLNRRKEVRFPSGLLIYVL